MTAFEKMVSGQLYDPSDPHLTAIRDRTRTLVLEFNNAPPALQNRRNEILASILGGFGEGSHIEPSVRFDYGCNTYIGENCFFNFDCVFLDVAPVRIGNDVFVGPCCSFLTPLHALLARQRNCRRDENGRLYDLEYAAPITVEDNVWLGGGVIVNPGVTIGHDCVIGSGSVVTRDIPPGVIAVGNPCRVLRPITEGDALEGL